MKPVLISISARKEQPSDTTSKKPIKSPAPVRPSRPSTPKQGTKTQLKPITEGKAVKVGGISGTITKIAVTTGRQGHTAIAVRFEGADAKELKEKLMTFFGTAESVRTRGNLAHVIVLNKDMKYTVATKPSMPKPASKDDAAGTTSPKKRIAELARQIKEFDKQIAAIEKQKAPLASEYRKLNPPPKLTK